MSQIMCALRVLAVFTLHALALVGGSSETCDVPCKTKCSTTNGSTWKTVLGNGSWDAFEGLNYTEYDEHVICNNWEDFLERNREVCCNFFEPGDDHDNCRKSYEWDGDNYPGCTCQPLYAGAKCDQSFDDYLG